MAAATPPQKRTGQADSWRRPHPQQGLPGSSGYRRGRTWLPQQVPPGQQGEGQRLALLILDAQFSQGAHGRAEAAPLQLLHQQLVAGTPSGHQQFQRLGSATEVLGHHCGAEGRQRGQGIRSFELQTSAGGPAAQIGQAGFQVAGPKQFPAGGLGGGGC